MSKNKGDCTRCGASINCPNHTSAERALTASEIDWKARAESWERTANTLSAHLRMQFAAEAMNGLMAGFSVDTLGFMASGRIAKVAFMVADAMLEEASNDSND